MVKKRKPALSFSDQLRQFIDQSELSRNQICLQAGIDPSHLHRFYHGSGRLSNDTIDKLTEALELRLVVER